jgi:hypothetical protein
MGIQLEKGTSNTSGAAIASIKKASFARGIEK